MNDQNELYNELLLAINGRNQVSVLEVLGILKVLEDQLITTINELDKKVMISGE